MYSLRLYTSFTTFVLRKTVPKLIERLEAVLEVASSYIENESYVCTPIKQTASTEMRLSVSANNTIQKVVRYEKPGLPLI